MEDRAPQGGGLPGCRRPSPPCAFTRGAGSCPGPVLKGRWSRSRGPTTSRRAPSYRRPLGGRIYLIKLGGHNGRKRVILNGTLRRKGQRRDDGPERTAVCGFDGGDVAVLVFVPRGSQETVTARPSRVKGTDKPGETPAVPPVPWGSWGRFSRVGSRASANTCHTGEVCV